MISQSHVAPTQLLVTPVTQLLVIPVESHASSASAGESAALCKNGQQQPTDKVEVTDGFRKNKMHRRLDIDKKAYK